MDNWHNPKEHHLVERLVMVRLVSSLEWPNVLHESIELIVDVFPSNQLFEHILTEIDRWIYPWINHEVLLVHPVLEFLHCKSKNILSHTFEEQSTCVLRLLAQFFSLLYTEHQNPLLVVFPYRILFVFYSSLSDKSLDVYSRNLHHNPINIFTHSLPLSPMLHHWIVVHIFDMDIISFVCWDILRDISMYEMRFNAVMPFLTFQIIIHFKEWISLHIYFSDQNEFLSDMHMYESKSDR